MYSVYPSGSAGNDGISSTGTRRRFVGVACIVATTLSLTPAPAFSQQAGYYAGKNSAGLDVEVYVVPVNGMLSVVGMGLSGHEYCNGKLVRGMEGGGVDGTGVDGRAYPIVDGRTTFSSLQPQFYLATDMEFSGDSVRGTATYQAPLFIGSVVPPQKSGVVSCTTGPLTFTAKFMGNEPTAAHSVGPGVP